MNLEGVVLSLGEGEGGVSVKTSLQAVQEAVRVLLEDIRSFVVSNSVCRFAAILETSPDSGCEVGEVPGVLLGFLAAKSGRVDALSSSGKPTLK